MPTSLPFTAAGSRLKTSSLTVTTSTSGLGTSPLGSPPSVVEPGAEVSPGADVPSLVSLSHAVMASARMAHRATILHAIDFCPIRSPPRFSPHELARSSAQSFAR